MSQSLIKLQTPEEKELESKRSELSALSEQLAEVELQFEELKFSLLNFQRRYFQEVGRKYVELDELRAQIAEFIGKNKPYDDEARTSAKQARDQADTASKEYESFKSQDPSAADYKPPSNECKKLYRRIASIIHPDKATDDAKRELGTKLMKELNAAYKMRDMVEMENILACWQGESRVLSSDGIKAELKRINRAVAQLCGRIIKVKQEIEDQMESELHSLMITVHNADAEGRNLLSEMVVRLDRQIAETKRELNILKKNK